MYKNKNLKSPPVSLIEMDHQPLEIGPSNHPLYRASKGRANPRTLEGPSTWTPSYGGMCEIKILPLAISWWKWWRARLSMKSWSTVASEPLWTSTTSKAETRPCFTLGKSTMDPSTVHNHFHFRQKISHHHPKYNIVFSVQESWAWCLTITKSAKKKG